MIFSQTEEELSPLEKALKINVGTHRLSPDGVEKIIDSYSPSKGVVLESIKITGFSEYSIRRYWGAAELKTMKKEKVELSKEELKKIKDVFIRNDRDAFATYQELPHGYRKTRRILRGMGLKIKKGPKRPRGPNVNQNFLLFDYTHNLILGGFSVAAMGREMGKSSQAIWKYLEYHPELPKPIDGRKFWRRNKQK
jgi:hypothetical protein